MWLRGEDNFTNSTEQMAEAPSALQEVLSNAVCCRGQVSNTITTYSFTGQDPSTCLSWRLPSGCFSLASSSWAQVALFTMASDRSIPSARARCRVRVLYFLQINSSIPASPCCRLLF